MLVTDEEIGTRVHADPVATKIDDTHSDVDESKRITRSLNLAQFHSLPVTCSITP